MITTIAELKVLRELKEQNRLLRELLAEAKANGRVNIIQKAQQDINQ